MVGPLEACKILEIDKRTLYRRIDSGEIVPPTKVKGLPGYVWVESDLVQYRDEIGIRKRAPAGQTAAEYEARLAARRDPEVLRKQIAQLEAELQVAEDAQGSRSAPKS